MNITHLQADSVDFLPLFFFIIRVKDSTSKVIIL